MNDDVEQAVNLGLELVLLSTRAQVRGLLDGQAFELDGLVLSSLVPVLVPELVTSSPRPVSMVAESVVSAGVSSALTGSGPTLPIKAPHSSSAATHAITW